MKQAEFSANIADFLLYVRTKKNLSDHTCRAYSADLNQFQLFWINTLPASLLKEALGKFRSHLIKNKASNSTLARKLSCFNTYEKFMAEQGIDLNLKLIRPYVPTPIPTALSMQEIHFLLDKVTTASLSSTHPHRDKAIFELLYATGIRCSELIAIRLSHIDMETKSIIIHTHTQRKNSRTVFFGDKTKEQLMLYMQNERKNADSKEEYLFLNYRSQPLTSRSIQRICNMFGNLLPQKKTITPHILRHSFAAHLLDQGTDPKMVQQLLGFNTSMSIEKYL